ncbi:hypothetical protein EC973_007832, partial [Apophysomyces ossiformis]
MFDVREIIRKLIDNTNTEVVLPALRILAEQSVIVGDDQLQTALSAELATVEDNIVNATQYYVRSMQLNLDQARNILQRYTTDYHDPDFSANFNNLIRTYGSARHIWIRYVGCTLASTPLQRLQDDLARHMQNRFGNFSRTVNELYPDLNYRVYRIPRLNLSEGTRIEADMVERMLVHLLGRHALLNSQAGGFYHEYEPVIEDQAMVRSLDLDQARQYMLESTNSLTTTNVTEQTEAIYQTYHNYQIKLEELGAGYAEDLTEDHIELFAYCAFPSLNTRVSGFVPLTVFSSDISKEEFKHCQAAFDVSRSGKLMVHLMKMAMAIEQIGEDTLRPSFINLWPTLNTEHLELHIETTSEVLKQLRSLVMVTLGYEPAAVALSNFHGNSSIQRSEYTSLTGEATLINYDSNFSYAEEPEGAEPRSSWAVLIPHIQSGSVNYGSASPVLLRFLYLCWVRTVILLNCCLQLLSSSSSNVVPGSKAFATTLLQRFKRHDQEAGMPRRMANAKNAVIALWGQVTDRKGKARERVHGEYYESWTPEQRAEHNSKVARERSYLIGDTRGSKGSEERRKQSLEVFRHKYAALRAWQGYHDFHKWTKWFLKQDEGKSILHLTMREIQIEATTAIGNLSPEETYFYKQIAIPPRDAEDDSWISNPELREQARQRKGEQMRANLPADFFNPENQKKRSLLRSAAIPYEARMEGKQ